MPEERITLKFREKKLVWNREILYQDYILAERKALIIAGNENSWLQYREGKYFTPDFFIMVTSFDLSSVDLYIRYGADAPMKWNCSGYPLYRCSQSLEGTYATEAECQAACKAPPGPCQPPYGQRYCVDSQTIAVWNQKTCKYDIAKCSTGVCRDGMCAPPLAPALSGGKEYVFEYSGPILQNDLVMSAIRQIVSLLGGKDAYIEGNNKLVVVM